LTGFQNAAIVRALIAMLVSNPASVAVTIGRHAFAAGFWWWYATSEEAGAMN
jgi:hypothetical protein